jgi:hypothetical protein
MKKFKNLFASLFENKVNRRENLKLKQKYKEIDSKKKRRDGQPKRKRCNCDRCIKGRQCRMNRNILEEDESLLVETIVKRDDKYVILSKKGKVLGTYDSHSAASERLKQIEYFKSLDENI